MGLPVWPHLPKFGPETAHVCRCLRLGLAASVSFSYCWGLSSPGATLPPMDDIRAVRCMAGNAMHIPSVGAVVMLALACVGVLVCNQQLLK